jgi:hypothetical protein
MNEKINAGNLYDLNKQIMKNKTPINHLELVPIQLKVEDWFNWKVDNYAMLLCREQNDYTIFHLYENQNPNPCAIAASEFIGCLIDRGDILSIDETEDGAWECWIKIGEEPYCYYLFPYDNAVIEC